MVSIWSLRRTTLLEEAWFSLACHQPCYLFLPSLLLLHYRGISVYISDDVLNSSTLHFTEMVEENPFSEHGVDDLERFSVTDRNSDVVPAPSEQLKVAKELQSKHNHSFRSLKREVDDLVTMGNRLL